ncbi:hypothetical protein FM076_31195 [Streptomyces albus subsp. chlorinus]|uniref:hypothetical protein n=1 Tax=Streptomyces albus TaxID=1888 RepID=UPI00156E6C58|nr:hypothetical protein [Streptomyces albus]NSC25378.1 hypothetical protein [Streptomyces albus subsp. chlorinus]
MNRIPVLRALVLAAATIGAVGAATPANATSVIGLGNAAFGNACADHGGSRADGATTRHSGLIGGLGAALPASSPAVKCGDLGLPTVLREEVGVDAVSELTGGEM